MSFRYNQSHHFILLHFGCRMIKFERTYRAQLAPCMGISWQKLHASDCYASSLQLKQEQLKRDRVVAPYSRSYGRTLIRTVVESDGGGVHLVSPSECSQGWPLWKVISWGITRMR